MLARCSVVQARLAAATAWAGPLVGVCESPSAAIARRPEGVLWASAIGTVITGTLAAMAAVRAAEPLIVPAAPSESRMIPPRARCERCSVCTAERDGGARIGGATVAAPVR